MDYAQLRTYDPPVTPKQWRKTVGAAIEARRTELRLSVRAAAKLAGFSESQWRQIESGERKLTKDIVVVVNPKPATRQALCRAIQWTDDSIDLLVAGEQAIAISPIETFAGAANAIGIVPFLDAELGDAVRADLSRTPEQMQAMVRTFYDNHPEKLGDIALSSFELLARQIAGAVMRIESLETRLGSLAQRVERVAVRALGPDGSADETLPAESRTAE